MSSSGTPKKPEKDQEWIFPGQPLTFMFKSIRVATFYFGKNSRFSRFSRTFSGHFPWLFCSATSILSAKFQVFQVFQTNFPYFSRFLPRPLLTKNVQNTLLMVIEKGIISLQIKMARTHLIIWVKHRMWLLKFSADFLHSPHNTHYQRLLNFFL